jgi:hypothetical protein
MDLVSYLKEMIWARSVTRIMRVHKGLGCAVAKLVEALRYKPEGRGFDSSGGY